MSWDTQQRRAYKAERAFDVDASTTHVDKVRGGPTPLWHSHEVGRASFGGAVLVRKEKDRQAVEARINQLVDLIVATDWWKSTGKPRPTVGRSSDGNAFASYSGVYFPKYASLNTGVVVAHELAHTLNPQVGHGHWWAGAFLRLVEMVMGPWYAHLLANHFTEKDVKFSFDRWADADRLAMPLYDVVAVEHGLRPLSTAGELAAARKAAREALPLGAETFEQPDLFAA